MASNDVLCMGHRQPALKLTVKKEGPNKGRQFWKCGNAADECKFFKWDDSSKSPHLNGSPSQKSSRTNYSSQSTASRFGSPTKRARYHSPDEWSDGIDDSALMEISIPSNSYSPAKRKAKGNTVADSETEDDIQDDSLQDPPRPTANKYATPTRLSSAAPLNSTPPSTSHGLGIESQPQTPADEIAAPLIKLFRQVFPTIQEACQPLIADMEKEASKYSRLQLAKTKQLEFKEKQLQDAKVEIRALEARIRSLEEENAALKRA